MEIDSEKNKPSISVRYKEHLKHHLTISEAMELMKGIFSRPQINKIYLMSGQKLTPEILCRFSNRDVTEIIHGIENVVKNKSVLQVILTDTMNVRNKKLMGEYGTLIRFISKDDLDFITTKLSDRHEVAIELKKHNLIKF